MTPRRTYITQDQIMEYVHNPRFRSSTLLRTRYGIHLEKGAFGVAIGVVMGFPSGDPKHGNVEDYDPDIPMVPTQLVIVLNNFNGFVPRGVAWG